MTKRCSSAISADSITGAIFAFEGIRNAIVLLNGPMGCRFYHSTTSNFLTTHPLMYLPSKEGSDPVPVDYGFLNDFFFRQSRVPSTYLDGYDYVFGTMDKVRKALLYIRDNVSFQMLAIVNSPGASLIGDALKDLAAEVLPQASCVMLESPGLSQDYEDGYDLAIKECLVQVASKSWGTPQGKVHDRPSVNVFGLSIWQKYAEGDAQELSRLLALCGIDVNCFVGCNCTLDELQCIPEADLNLVLYPEMAAQTMEALRRLNAGPIYVCDLPPIGFKATHRMLAEVCSLLGCSAEAAFEEEERTRGRAWFSINGVHQASGLPEGVTACIDAMPSLKAGYEAFLSDYLGLICDQSDVFQTDAELVFADANAIAALKVKEKTFCGIEIALPSMGYVDVLPKTHLGYQGALLLIEQVLNGIMSKL